MLRHLRIFRYVEEVARAGSFRRAAEVLYLTPSAVQRRIQDIEDDLQAPIFERTSQGVRLTTTGELFLRWIKMQFAELDLVLARVNDVDQLRHGQVRIACSQALMQSILPGAIMQFRAQFPLVTFHVVVQDHETALRSLIEFETDLTLTFRPSGSRHLDPLASFDQRLVAVMAARHPLAVLSQVSLKQCLGFPLALTDVDFGGRRIVEESLASCKETVDLSLVSNSIELIRNFVRTSEAIAFEVEICASALEERGLVMRPIVDPMSCLPLVLAKLRDRTLPTAATMFAGHMKACLESISADNKQSYALMRAGGL
ncbi:MAG: LysR family transcriptional regulator [Parvibaculaceae bacterium]